MSSFLLLSFKTPFEVSVQYIHTTGVVFFYGRVSPKVLWPPLVYNLNNTEQVATQRVRNFAPTDSTTKFLHEHLDEKVPS